MLEVVKCSVPGQMTPLIGQQHTHAHRNQHLDLREFSQRVRQLEITMRGSATSVDDRRGNALLTEVLRLLQEADVLRQCWSR